MESHANEGAQAVADALGRSVRSVECRASRYGISLRKRWICPKCGLPTYSPLSPRYGWCETCCIERTKAGRLQKNQAMRAEVKAEKARLTEAKRARQAVYADTNRRKNELHRIRELREEIENTPSIC